MAEAFVLQRRVGQPGRSHYEVRARHQARTLPRLPKGMKNFSRSPWVFVSTQTRG